MAFNGSGVYVRISNWTSDANNALPISATKFDADGTDIASALSICLTRDGQGAPSGALTWAQNLTINRGADANNLKLARTGGSNNPSLTFSFSDSANTATISPSSTLVIAGSGASGPLQVNGAAANLVASFDSTL